MEKFTKVRVIFERMYFLPTTNNGKSIDGRDENEILKEWFEEFPLYQYHATRDSYAIGYSEKVIKFEKLN